MTATILNQIFQLHEDVVAIFDAAEHLHSYISYLNRFPVTTDEELQFPGTPEGALQGARNLEQQLDEVVATSPRLRWMFRRAYVHMFPGKLLKQDIASYHDLALEHAEVLISALQAPRDFVNKLGEPDVGMVLPDKLTNDGIKNAMEWLAEIEMDFRNAGDVLGYLTMEAACAANLAV